MSKIEWTGRTWNCVVGCEAVSPGCANCYAATMSRRLEAMDRPEYAGLTTSKHFNGVVRCLPERLEIPLRRKKPTTWFANSMSDLFHEAVPDEFIGEIYGVMATAERHIFQVLTKRPRRMAQFFDRYTRPGGPIGRAAPNVWLGVSVENPDALWRVDELLKTPAAVRFLSVEPLLEAVSLDPVWLCHGGDDCGACEPQTAIDWVIIGGESGPRARCMKLEWAEQIVEECKAADVPVFVKQLGSAHGRDHHKIETFPKSLQVREWPKGAA